MKEAEMATITHLIDEVIRHHTDDHRLASVRQAAQQLCKQFPITADRSTESAQGASADFYPFSMGV